MSNINLNGKFIKYNPVTNRIEIALDPLDPSIQASIEDLIQNSDKYLSMSFKYRTKMSAKDSLRKAWYGHLQKILQASDIFPSAYEMNNIDESCRRSIFPADIENEQVIGVKRMHQMNVLELQTAVNTLYNRYPIGEK